MYQNQVNNTLIPLPHSIEQLPQQKVLVATIFPKNFGFLVLSSAGFLLLLRIFFTLRQQNKCACCWGSIDESEKSKNKLSFLKNHLVDDLV